MNPLRRPSAGVRKEGSQQADGGAPDPEAGCPGGAASAQGGGVWSGGAAEAGMGAWPATLSSTGAGPAPAVPASAGAGARPVVVACRPPLPPISVDRERENRTAAKEAPMQWYLVAALLTILTSSQGILTTLSQSNGKYKYDYATIPFLAELFKLSVSSFFLWKECQSSSPPRMTKEWRSVRLFLVPSLIYLIHNNVQFATLTYVDPSTYQIMGNLKIVTTGILFRLVLKRKLSNLQWMAIVLLAIGTTTSQVKGCGDAPCDSFLSALLQGYMLGILSACLSALAGVYTEYLMKKNNDSLYWQNVQLYMFGVIFNMGWLIYGDFKAGFELGPWWQRLFNGYSITTWMVVFNLGSTGLLVSWLMKYSDNIVKVYSTSMAMLLTMILSIYLFSVKATIQLFLGVMICIISLQMYFMPVHMLVELPQTLPVTSK